VRKQRYRKKKETGLKETGKNKHQVRPMGIYYSKRVVQILQGDSTGSVLETDGRDIRLALERNVDNILAMAEVIVKEEEEKEEDPES
jgi:hypothetical protein